MGVCVKSYRNQGARVAEMLRSVQLDHTVPVNTTSFTEIGRLLAVSLKLVNTFLQKSCLQTSYVRQTHAGQAVIVQCSNQQLIQGPVHRNCTVRLLDGRASARGVQWALCDGADIKFRAGTTSIKFRAGRRPVGGVDVVGGGSASRRLDLALHCVDDVRHRCDELMERWPQLGAWMPTRQHHAVPVTIIPYSSTAIAKGWQGPSAVLSPQNIVSTRDYFQTLQI